MKNKKNVLIIGSSAKEYALAKYIANLEYVDKVYVAPGNVVAKDFAEVVDIREDAVSELLEFVIKNDINFTIASSSNAIKADIASYFKENAQPIFAPDAKISEFTTSRSTAKKFLYRLHFSTPRFGIFEKQQIAVDYLKNAKFPLLITSDTDEETSIRAVCANVLQAKSCINDLFMQDYDKVVIEEYVYGHPFTFYIITDGYQALPLGVVGDYKFREDGDGGLFTLGMGAYVPDYKISFEKVNYIMNSIVYPIIETFQNKQTPFMGILGIECVLKQDDNVMVTGFVPFLKDHDAQAVLNSLDIDFLSLLEACTNGSFADDYEDIPIKDSSNISCVLYSRKAGSVISGLELVDDTADIGFFSTTKNKFFENLTNKGRTLVITQSAATLSRAKELLYDNVEDIYFDGIKYRHDICVV